MVLRNQLIDRYREGPAEVDRALAGITEDELGFPHRRRGMDPA
ncbi:MAG: hypothetical protein R2855_09870 [Thermomicrobiales bacterium]